MSSKTAETCNTHNMLKLSRHLCEREQRVVYADYCELALCNHLLGTIAPNSGHATYFTPVRPGDFRTYLDEPYCCQGMGIENTARFGEAIYFHHEEALWVNLFIPSTLDWRERGLKLRTETTYPENGECAHQPPYPVVRERHCSARDQRENGNRRRPCRKLPAPCAPLADWGRHRTAAAFEPAGVHKSAFCRLLDGGHAETQLDGARLGKQREQ